ncbi:MAG: hypothetical protein Q8O48_00725, partial [Anaerolineales bacterium]|nr:hypothetical protein [Anaerolineales bacterium]
RIPRIDINFSCVKFADYADFTDWDNKKERDRVVPLFYVNSYILCLLKRHQRQPNLGNRNKNKTQTSGWS